ncbi:putative 3-oxoacyl-[acyl-carrier-protein] synthase [Fusarium proliferatum]|uniref:beta-ketoacyl-[acyl-carrier-protein] synthase I n=1 Tax=Gibberella intermedia TaxID=948311 RepID=A0A420THL5_GIBIN|nr:putative 3-oxoacyl-[acyl-carrier-protein] synthase [Fusarium proliferatum]
MRRVVVTGLGAITPLGVGVRRTWTRLINNECGIVSVADLQPQARWKELTSTVSGLVPSGDGEGRWRASDWVNTNEQRRMSKFTQYAIAASDMALRDSGWEPKNAEQQEATGVCLGSGIGNLDEIYETSLVHHQDGYKKVSPLFVPKILINMAAGHVAMKYGFQGPNHTATTACTTGAHSIGDAARFITMGDADVMVAGGSESCIHPLTFAGFGRARSLSTAYNDNPTASCRPFDADRNGFVVSEGAAMVVLEELEHAKARGAHIYAEIKGYGCSGDAHHMTAPREDGHGAYLAMKKALKSAGIKPSQVDYINAHATATHVGDIAETSAIKRIMLGEEGHQKESDVTVSSTKGAVGHLLGAAGAIEALFCILAIHEGVVPATLNLQKPDVGAAFNFVPNEAQEKTARAVLRAAMRAGASRAAAPTTRNFLPPAAVVTRRHFSNTSSRSLLKGIGKSMAEPYRVLGATEQLFKASAKAADYHITEKERKDDQVQLAEDGEEIGHSLNPDSPWHHTFKLPPTFSTWSHVTMLHLYLINTRIRCFDREGFQNWQHQLTDHFFFECEKKMHIDHHITSSALRQRYLKDIFVQWRGLLLAYDEGLIKGDAMLASAIWRNLFKGSADADPRALLAIVGWMRSTLLQFEAVSDNNLPAQLPVIMAKPVDVFWTRLEKQLGGQQEDSLPAKEVKEEPVSTEETAKVSAN